ncbi:MAG: tetratricopeptide repeat protein [bacterium]|nr:tetratricopeptide repeat protein [bacterium]
MRRWLAFFLLIFVVPASGCASSGDGAETSEIDDPVALRAVALQLHEQGREEEALVHFEELARSSADERSLMDLGLAYSNLSRLDDAATTYHRLIELAPRNAVALHNLGNVDLRRGRIDEAIDWYERAIEIDPRYFNAHLHLGDAFKQADRFPEAYRSWERLLQLEPTKTAEATASYEALYRMASLDITMGAYARAGQMLALLLEEVPQHESAHYAMGQVLLQLGRPEEAEREFAIHVRIWEERPTTSQVASD